MLNKKGNIVLALLISLLLVTTTMSIYVGFARDRQNSELTRSRIQEKIEMNSYVVAAQASIFDYFNTIEIPIVYAQYLSVNGTDTVVHRVAVTDPVIVDTQNIQTATISNNSYVLLKEYKNADFAGYKYDVKIAFDVPPEQSAQNFRVANLMLNPNDEFWEDNNIYLKPQDAYTVKLKDIPIIIVINYDTWEQHVKAVIKGLEFKREMFDILRYGDSIQGGTDISNIVTTGVARGAIITDNATMRVVQSYRYRK